VLSNMFQKKFSAIKCSTGELILDYIITSMTRTWFWSSSQVKPRAQICALLFETSICKYYLCIFRRLLQNLINNLKLILQLFNCTTSASQLYWNRQIDLIPNLGENEKNAVQMELPWQINFLNLRNFCWILTRIS
jgi:hypothetical protein